MPTERRISPTHPGEILRSEFLEPLSLSEDELAQRLNAEPARVREIVHEERALTADMALRLSRFFGNSPEFWLGLQTQYDLDRAEDELRDVLSAVVPLETA